MMIALVFDTETTGLIENHTIKLTDQPEVIEFGAIMFTWGNPDDIIDEYTTLCRRQGKWMAKDKDRPPISEEELAQAPKFSEVAPVIRNLLEGSAVVIGHNLSFDMEMIDLEFDRLQQTIKWP